MYVCVYVCVCVCVCAQGEKKHLLLVDPSGQVRTKDMAFDSVSHLINYHFRARLPIISRGRCVCVYVSVCLSVSVCVCLCVCLCVSVHGLCPLPLPASPLSCLLSFLRRSPPPSTSLVHNLVTPLCRPCSRIVLGQAVRALPGGYAKLAKK